MPGLVPGIHDVNFDALNAWMAGTSPAMTSRRAGAKPGDDVVALGREEVAIAGPRQARAGRPRSAAQRFSGAEPRLRIILVRVRGEAGKRQEIRGRPFPHVAEHLPAAERAVACWERCDVDRRREGEIEIGVPMVGRRLAPWPAALALGKPRAARDGLADRRRLPL